jgi:murein L,D-transpeptidase YcbB/YkuD
VNWRTEGARVSFRQRPGAANSLGFVKFQFPNPFNVYLHDTPNDALFRRARRTLSHGCVRLEKPEALARWVLEGRDDWPAARIAKVMRGGRETSVALGARVPLAIAYFTVWVDEDGTVRFGPDVYRHDAAQQPLIDGEDAVPAGTGRVASAG